MVLTLNLATKNKMYCGSQCQGNSRKDALNLMLIRCNRKFSKPK